jgi:hypothetical protein
MLMHAREAIKWKLEKQEREESTRRDDNGQRKNLSDISHDYKKRIEQIDDEGIMIDRAQADKIRKDKFHKQMAEKFDEHEFEEHNRSRAKKSLGILDSIRDEISKIGKTSTEKAKVTLNNLFSAQPKNPPAKEERLPWE